MRYRYSNPKVAHVFVGISIRNQQEAQALIQELRQNGLATEDMSDNEMAKLHIRHLVGGHALAVTNEILYRFEFPDRPGALMNFLNNLSHNWNISLFHYRNHGADYGRVLIGIQVPPEEKPDFKAFLDQLGYRYWNETKNPAYKLFLA